MTEKLPRRWSKRLGIAGASAPGSTTGVQGTGKRARRTSEAPSRELGVARVPGGEARAPESEAHGRDGGAHAQCDTERAAGLVADGAAGAGPVGDGAARDGMAFDGVAIDGVAVDGVAVDGVAVDGVAMGAPAPLVGQLPRALVVDDDPEIRRALSRLLRPELDVHLAGSVAQAEAVLAHLDRVDVAFVDWQLPDGTGEQILERLSRWPDSIRVLISGRVSSSENPLRNRALANLVLGKPLAPGVVDALKRAALALPHD